MQLRYRVKTIRTTSGVNAGIGRQPINVSTHQFRHYLNTLAQAGGLSQLDIAKRSGRKNIHQNTAYDHVTPSQLVQKIHDSLADGSTIFDPLAELAKRRLFRETNSRAWLT